MALRLPFRRSQPMVAVRPHALTAELTLQPGDVIPDTLPVYRRMSLYKRGIAAMSGCAWAKAKLAALGVPARRAPRGKKAAEPAA